MERLSRGGSWSGRSMYQPASVETQISTWKGRDMGWFRDLNIGKQLAVAFGLLELLMLGLGIFGLEQLSRVNDTTLQVVSREMPSVKVVEALKYDASAVRRSELSHLLAFDHKEKWDAPLKQALADLEEHESQYQRFIGSDQERALDQEFRAAWRKYLAVHEQAVVLAKENEYQANLLAQSAGGDAFEAAARILEDEV